MRGIEDNRGTGRLLSANRGSQYSLRVEELDDLLRCERKRTIQFILVVCWLMPLTLFMPFIHHQIAWWYVSLLFLYAATVQVLHLLRQRYVAFMVAGIGAFSLFIVEMFLLPYGHFLAGMNTATLFTLTGTLFFRRRYLLYANLSAAFIVAVTIALPLIRDEWIINGRTASNLIDAVLFFGFISYACWMFLLRSLRLFERLTDAKAALMVDGLTDAYSRAYFHRFLAQLENSDSPECVSLLMLDVDHFKRVNDTYGHLVGDQVLAHFSAVVQRHIRQADALIRIGGEEFALIIRHDGHLPLADYASRLLVAIGDSPYHVDDVTSIRLTASIGGATLCQPGESPHDWLSRTDQALYIAKEERNQAIIL